MCLHFWRKGLPKSEMLTRVHDMGFQDVVSAHPVFSYVATDGLNHSLDDLVNVDTLSENLRQYMVRPEQGSFFLRKNII